MNTIVIDGIFFQINEWSGIAKYWMNLLNDIESYLDRDNTNSLNVYLLVRGSSRPLRSRSFNKIKKLPIHYWDENCAFSDYEKLGQICKDLGADVFISTYYTLAYNLPNIGMAYDFIPERLNTIHDHISWKLKYIYMKSLHRIFSISKSTAREASIFYPHLESSLENIFYPHINEEECEDVDHTKTSQFRDKFSLNYPYIAVVGHRGSYKNVDILKKSKNHPIQPIPLGLIVSSGEELSDDDLSFYNKTFAFGIRRLLFNEHDMIHFFRAAEFLFYPSLLEGFGYPILEAMTQGCPVITTGSTSMGEILIHANEYEYELISGFDSDESYQAIYKLMNKAVRVSPATINRFKKSFGASKAEQFIRTLLDYAELNECPRDDYLKECLTLDGFPG